MEECVDILAEKLYKRGKIKDKCEKAGVYERMTLLEKQFKGATILLIKTGYLPPAFRALWSNERLLNVVEQLIGPNIAGDLEIALITRQNIFVLKVLNHATRIPA